VDDFDDVKEVRKRILEDDEDGWLIPYKLRKTPKGDCSHKLAARS